MHKVVAGSEIKRKWGDREWRKIKVLLTHLGVCQGRLEVDTKCLTHSLVCQGCVRVCQAGKSRVLVCQVVCQKSLRWSSCG